MNTCLEQCEPICVDAVLKGSTVSHENPSLTVLLLGDLGTQIMPMCAIKSHQEKPHGFVFLGLSWALSRISPSLKHEICGHD
jgi:hypothetical protein